MVNLLSLVNSMTRRISALSVDPRMLGREAALVKSKGETLDDPVQVLPQSSASNVYPKEEYLIDDMAVNI